jgi:hypothetical protein
MIDKKWHLVVGAVLVCGLVATLPTTGASGHWRHHHHHHHAWNHQQGATSGQQESAMAGSVGAHQQHKGTGGQTGK